MLWSIAAALFVVGGCFWWWVPKWQMRSITAADPKARADIEDNFRKTIGQAVGGLFVLIGAGLAYNGTLQTLQANQQQFTAQQDASRQQFTAQQETARQQLEEQQKASRDLLISNQVAKGFELFGSDNLRVKLGGIYALEGVMNTSEEYYQPVLEALSAFVRDNTQSATGEGPPATDIQAALTVIGRRKREPPFHLNLANVHIPQADLFAAYLPGADLGGANLAEAKLGGADLGGAFLGGVDLHGAILDGANLRGAILDGANLHRAGLGRSNLRGATLREADLTDAVLLNASLGIAILGGAALINAMPLETNLTGAHLHGANVSQEQLDKACGTDVKLDPGLTIKPCPAGGSSKQ